MKEIYNINILWLFFFTFLVLNIQAQNSNFVTLQGKKFRVKDQNFYPLSMNYIVDIVHNNQGDFYIAPHHSYFTSNHFECQNEQECFDEVLNDFITIKNMGFNSIRLAGVEFGPQIDQNGNYTIYPAFKSKDIDNNSMITPLTSNYNNIFYFIQKSLDAATLADLKVQIIVGGQKIDDQTFRVPYLAYLQSIASHFSDNSTLYAYDFKNEPLYFDTGNYSKGEICNLVEDWHLAIKNNSPQHLTTLGLTTSSEVKDWNPGILKLDFLSFHLSSNIFDVVKSEIKWICETSRLPWIIKGTDYAGSTSRTGKQRTIQNQRNFAKATLEMLNQSQPVQDIIVNNTTIQVGESQNYEASNSINSLNMTIEGNGDTGGNCSMKATQIVRLKTGFSAQKGSYFRAYNAPVYADCNYTTNYLNRNTKEEPFLSSTPVKSDRIDESISINSAIDEVFKSSSVLIYPNPSNGIFNVISNDNLAIDKIEIYNNLGQKIYELNGQSTHNHIDISGNVKSLYLLKVYKGETVQSFRVVYK